MTEIQERGVTRTRRSGARASNAGRASSVRSRRGSRQPAESALAELEPMISLLIKENRELHRQIDKLSKQTVGAASGTMDRALRALQRRVSASLDGKPSIGSSRSTRVSTTKARRKVTDPQLLERRRQALAKARE